MSAKRNKKGGIFQDFSKGSMKMVSWDKEAEYKGAGNIIRAKRMKQWRRRTRGKGNGSRGRETEVQRAKSFE